MISRYDGKKYGQIGIQLSAWVENIVGKGEIARNEQFLLFPQCFQKQSIVDVLKRVYMDERVKRAFRELNNIFLRATLIKIYHNSQRMSYSFYHITEYSELKKNKEKKVPKHTHTDISVVIRETSLTTSDSVNIA